MRRTSRVWRSSSHSRCRRSSCRLHVSYRCTASSRSRSTSCATAHIGPPHRTFTPSGATSLNGRLHRRGTSRRCVGRGRPQGARGERSCARAHLDALHGGERHERDLALAAQRLAQVLLRPTTSGASSGLGWEGGGWGRGRGGGAERARRGSRRPAPGAGCCLPRHPRGNEAKKGGAPHLEGGQLRREALAVALRPLRHRAVLRHLPHQAHTHQASAIAARHRARFGWANTVEAPRLKPPAAGNVWLR